MNTHKPYSTLAVALSAASLLTLQGCGALGLGEEEFSCDTNGNGEACTSTWDMYEKTNNGNRPQQQESTEGKDGKQGSAANLDSAIPGNGESDFVIDEYVSPRLPNGPVPVRTPPHVLRVWVAPYEDTEGDFQVSGYVYTEVEPRRWTLGTNGDGGLDDDGILRPLE